MTDLLLPALCRAVYTSAQEVLSEGAVTFLANYLQEKTGRRCADWAVWCAANPTSTARTCPAERPPPRILFLASPGRLHGTSCTSSRDLCKITAPTKAHQKTQLLNLLATYCVPTPCGRWGAVTSPRPLGRSSAERAAFLWTEGGAVTTDPQSNFHLLGGDAAVLRAGNADSRDGLLRSPFFGLFRVGAANLVVVNVHVAAQREAAGEGPAGGGRGPGGGRGGGWWCGGGCLGPRAHIRSEGSGAGLRSLVWMHCRHSMAGSPVHVCFCFFL